MPGVTRCDLAKHILVIEDDADMARSVCDVLEAMGYGIISVESGRAALEYLRHGVLPSLILLDMMMPEMDGWQFRAEQQRLSRAAEIPVVVVTADGRAPSKAASIQADGWVEKPFAIATLLGEIERLIGVAEEEATPPP